LVPPHAPDALADALEAALDDPAATARRTAAARLRIEQELSFDARMRKVEQIYDALVDEHRRATRTPTSAVA
jgi:glycosyltransferase involved in cell wall biosynthesis